MLRCFVSGITGLRTLVIEPLFKLELLGRRVSDPLSNQPWYCTGLVVSGQNYRKLLDWIRGGKFFHKFLQ